MHQGKLFLLLIGPSVASFAGCALLAGLLLSATGWDAVSRLPAVHNYLGIGTVLLNAPDGSSAFFKSLVDKSITYNVILIGSGAVIAALVFFVLTVAERGLAGVLDSWLFIKFSSARSKRAAEQDVGTHAAARAVVFVGWVVY